MLAREREMMWGAMFETVHLLSVSICLHYKRGTKRAPLWCPYISFPSVYSVCVVVYIVCIVCKLILSVASTKCLFFCRLARVLLLLQFRCALYGVREHCFAAISQRIA